ncbi:MAG: copper homeostasis protein CutC, partial [Eubacteriales bacterium]|nr:copper homeostasis protein CutC [Eubacteriales bacterium]
CVDSYESAINSYKGGANRLELCSNLIIGGTTPSIELFKKIKNNLDIKINVLIRPRFGDFLYSDDEFDIIKKEVKMFKENGANGIVFGALKPNGELDIEKMQEIINICSGIDVTLHRAFDVCKNPFETLEQSIKLGINTILTSGQENESILGKELLKELVKKANGSIDILVGAGVSYKNIEELAIFTGAKDFHLSGKIEKDSLMQYRKENVNMGLKNLSEYIIWETSEENIKKAKNILEKIN